MEGITRPAQTNGLPKVRKAGDTIAMSAGAKPPSSLENFLFLSNPTKKGFELFRS